MPMQSFEIFKPGTHTSAAGAAITFSEADLQAAVAAYDPALHEAPITVGHPKDNLPAYGWIKALAYGESGMQAEPHQIDEAFAEMVEAGRFKKRSASFYTPDSPANPTPGTYYLRHVAFLGAQPPAVKGLKAVAFAEDEEGVVEFFEASITAGLFRRLREWIIGKHGLEDADSVVPNYLVEDLEATARQEYEKSDTPAIPAFTETGAPPMPQPNAPTAPTVSGTPGTPTAAAPTAPAADDFAERETALQARESALAAKESALARAGLTAQFQEHAAAGRIRPADVPRLVDFAAGLEDVGAVSFGEGDTATTATPRAFLLDFITQLPKAIEYGEQSGAEHGAPDAEDNHAVADRAQAYIKRMKADAGRTVSFTEAVGVVRAGTDK